MTIGGDLSLKMLGEKGVLCAFAVCTPEELSINYDFRASDASLIGSSICTEKTCSAGNFSHSIKTSNTQDFFLRLMESKIFNPLALIIAQSNLQKGLKVGDGHELKF